MRNVFRKLMIITSLLVTAVQTPVFAEEPTQDPNTPETVVEEQPAEETGITETEEEITIEEEPADEESEEVTDAVPEEEQEFVEKPQGPQECEACEIKAREAEEEANSRISEDDAQPFLNYVTDGTPAEGTLDITMYTDPDAEKIDNAQIERDLYHIAELETESGTLEEYFGREEYESDSPSQAEIDTEDNRKNPAPTEEPAYEEPAAEEPVSEEANISSEEDLSEEEQDAIEAAVQAALSDMEGSDYSAPKALVRSFFQPLSTVEQSAASGAYLYVQPPYPFVACGGIYGMSNGYHGAYYPMAWTFDYALDSSGNPVYCLEPWKPMSGSYSDGVTIRKDATITVNSDASTVRLDGNKMNNLVWACNQLYQRHRSPEAFYVGQLAIWNAVLAGDPQKGIDYVDAFRAGNSNTDLYAYVSALSNWGYGSPVAANSLAESTGLLKAAVGMNLTDNAVWSGGAAGAWGGLPDIDWKAGVIGDLSSEMRQIYYNRLNSHAQIQPTNIYTEGDVTGERKRSGRCVDNKVNMGSGTIFRIQVTGSNEDVILTKIDSGMKIYNIADKGEMDEFGVWHARSGATPLNVGAKLKVNTDYFVTFPNVADQTFQFQYSQIADPNQTGGTVWGQSDSCAQDVFTAGNFIDDVFIGSMCFTTEPSTVVFDKYNRETGQPLKDAILQLYKVDGTNETPVSAPLITNSNGRTQSLRIAPGRYKLYETEAPEGFYYARPIIITVMSDFMTPQTFIMEDEPIYLEAIKIDQRTGERLAGVGIDLRTYGGAILQSWISTLEPQQLDATHMRAEQKYKLHETSTVPGYLIQRKEVVFTIPKYKDEIEELGYELADDGKTIVLRMENPEIKYSVRKLDAQTGDYVQGAKMALMDSQGNVLFTWTTTDGATRIPPNLLKEGQTYAITEKEAPEGYYKIDKDKTFKVNVRNDEVEQMIFVDVFEYPINYAVTKTDKDTGNVVQGVTLGLFDGNTEMERWVTALEDHVIESTLEAGKTYYVKELETIPGYYLDTKAVPFTVKEASGKSRDDLTVKFENTKISFSVIKRDARTKQPIPGVTLALLDAETMQELYDFQTTEQPVMLNEQYLECGKEYIIREKASVKGYYYTANDIRFTVPATLEEARAQAGKKGFPIALSIEDHPIKYQVLKMDAETGDYLEGVDLALYEGSTMIDSWTTDGTPHNIEGTLLEPLKTYTLRETRTKNGYYFNDQSVTFTVSKTPDQSGVVKLVIANYPIEMKVRKVNEDGEILTKVNGQPFSFEIYDTNDTPEVPDDDTLIDSFTTGDNSYTITNWYTVPASKLTAGKTYRIHEANAPNGYMIADDAFVTIPEVKGSASIEIVIEDEKVSMKLKKVDEEGNTLTTYTTPDGKTYGFILDVYLASEYQEDPNAAQPVYTIDTSSQDYINNGYADISAGLKYGETYIIKERDYPVGYYKAQDKMIVLDGSVDSVEMIDPKLKAKFRKEDIDGSLLTTVDGVGFKFTLYDTNGTPDDISDDIAIAAIDTANSGTDGYIDLSNYLQEGRTYRLKETFAPNGFGLAPDKLFTMPTYYEGE